MVVTIVSLVLVFAASTLIGLYIFGVRIASATQTAFGVVGLMAIVALLVVLGMDGSVDPSTILRMAGMIVIMFVLYYFMFKSIDRVRNKSPQGDREDAK